MAVHSLVGTISPTLGGRIMAEYSFFAISYLGAVASAVVFVAISLRPLISDRRPLDVDVETSVHTEVTTCN